MRYYKDKSMNVWALFDESDREIVFARWLVMVRAILKKGLDKSNLNKYDVDAIFNMFCWIFDKEWQDIVASTEKEYNIKFNPFLKQDLTQKQLKKMDLALTKALGIKVTNLDVWIGQQPIDIVADPKQVKRRLRDNDVPVRHNYDEIM